ncbi:MAG: cupredoxin domain-containing protein [Betaproteobacteria bacterium]
MSIQSRLALALFAACVLGVVPASAEEIYTVVFKDHRIVPDVLEVPAGKKIKLVVDNQDPTPEEFESHSLNREKVIPGKSKATIFIGPLKPGSYEIFGEFHQDTAQGRIVAK